jgi:hypothetical protein
MREMPMPLMIASFSKYDTRLPSARIIGAYCYKNR